MSSFHLPTLPPLPIDSLKADCIRAFALPCFLVQASPGTGKSTRIPLWALAHFEKRILLLEPRRVAARMLAEHLASLLHSKVGGLVGLIMRRETKISSASRLIVVTEGVLTRMICDDPALEDVSCILFDEFHERHLASDTGLALSLRAQSLLRSDLVLGILSATLETEALAAKLQAPVISRDLKSFPVETFYLPPKDAPRTADAVRCMPRHMAQVTAGILKKEGGSLLAFLPGQGEIARTAEELAPLLPPDCDLFPLYGRLPKQKQLEALAPSPAGRRKVVLATDVAETSLTIEGVRIIVDSGLQKRMHYDPRRQSSRLVTGLIPLSSAEQRRGRAGRTEPGICLRLWSKAKEAEMLPHALPEICEAELSPLVLDLALWGEKAKDLPFVTQPPEGSLAASAKTLTSLGALDAQGSITSLGRQMAAMGLSPRTAAVLLAADDAHLPLAALICAFLEEPFSLGGSKDLACVLESLAKNADKRQLCALLSQAEYLLARCRKMRSQPDKAQAEKTQKDPQPLRASLLQNLDPALCGRLLLPGYADRLACCTGPAQDGVHAAGILRQGTGILLPKGTPRFVLALESILADTGRMQGNAVQKQASAALSLGCPVEEDDVLSCLSRHITEQRSVEMQESGQAAVCIRTTLDAFVLKEDRVQPAAEDADHVQSALCAYIVKKELSCLPFSQSLKSWLARVSFLAGTIGSPWPMLDKKHLLEAWEDWLPDLAAGCPAVSGITADSVSCALHNLLPWQCQGKLDELAPAFWTAPSGRKLPVHYEEAAPFAELKLQECFGLKETPLLAGSIPLALHLLSPSGAVLASSADLAYFWQHVYPSVRSEMRGRYPRHPWPEDPLKALPTALTNRALRTKGLL